MINGGIVRQPEIFELFLYHSSSQKKNTGNSGVEQQYRELQLH